MKSESLPYHIPSIPKFTIPKFVSIEVTYSNFLVSDQIDRKKPDIGKIIASVGL